MELKIESGLKPPRDMKARGRDRDVYRQMKDGDSVFFLTVETAHAFWCAARDVSSDFVPIRRKVEGGYRVWKVKREPKPNGHGE